MKARIFLCLMALVACFPAQAGNCQYPALKVQLAELEKSLSGCYSLDCFRMYAAAKYLGQIEKVSPFDIKLADGLSHLSKEMRNVSAILWHVATDHESKVELHNAVLAK